MSRPHTGEFRETNENEWKGRAETHSAFLLCKLRFDLPATLLILNKDSFVTCAISRGVETGKFVRASPVLVFSGMRYVQDELNTSTRTNHSRTKKKQRCRVSFSYCTRTHPLSLCHSPDLSLNCVCAYAIVFCRGGSLTVARCDLQRYRRRCQGTWTRAYLIFNHSCSPYNTCIITHVTVSDWFPNSNWNPTCSTGIER